MAKQCKHPTCGDTCRREKKPRTLYRIPQVSKKKMMRQADEKLQKASMDLYWLAAEKELAKHPYCMECGATIPKYLYIQQDDGTRKVSINAYRAATAHVLPKRERYGFPSVADNPVNRLFLGSGCGCHSRFDASWQSASQMKVFPMAIEIFRQLYPLLDPAEYKNIPDVFRPHIPCDVGA